VRPDPFGDHRLVADDLEAEERRLIGEADVHRGHRAAGDTSHYVAKDYVDALAVLASFYCEHARWFEAGSALRRQIRAIKDCDARAVSLPAVCLQLVEVEIAKGLRSEARAALREARRAMEATYGARDTYEKLAAKLEASIAKLPDTTAHVPAASPAERWRHPTFGEGSLEKRVDDVLHVRFADGVVRRIAQRYMRPLEGPGPDEPAADID
jgi:hypothetical protein